MRLLARLFRRGDTASAHVARFERQREESLAAVRRLKGQPEPPPREEFPFAGFVARPETVRGRRR